MFEDTTTEPMPVADDDPYGWADDTDEDNWDPSELDLDDSGSSVSDVGEATEGTEQKAEEPAQEPESDEAKPEEPKPTKDSESKPEEDADATSEESKEEDTSEPEEVKPPEITDDTEIDVDGAAVSVADLKEAYAMVDQAKEAYKEAQQRTEQVNNVTKQLVGNPIGTLLQLFTELSNPQQAYHHVLKLAEEVVAKHLEWEATPQEQRQARQLQAERDRLQRELDATRSKEKEAEEAKVREAADAEVREEIQDALKEAKVEVTDDAVRGVAEELLNAMDLGIEITTARAVKKYLKAVETKRVELLKTLKPEDLPPEVRKKANIDAATAKRSPKTGGTPAKRKKRDPEHVVINMSDYQDWLDGKLNK